MSPQTATLEPNWSFILAIGRGYLGGFRCILPPSGFPARRVNRDRPLAVAIGGVFVRNLNLSTNVASIIAYLIRMTISAIFCPYCLVVMTERAETNSYVCEKCGHIAAPDDLDHTCPCAKCADLQRKAG